MAEVLHEIERSLVHVEEVVPKVYENFHKEVQELLTGFREVYQHIRESLDKQKVMFGFDLLGGLTELPGGTNLGTVLKLMSLAEKTHRVINDAKGFVPHLQDTLSKMQNKIEGHVQEFASHVLQELGLPDVARSVVSQIEDLFFKVENEAHILILDLLHKMEQTFHVLQERLPEEYEKVSERVEEVRAQLHDLVSQIEQSLVMRSFSLLDLADNVTGGTQMSTVFKVMSLVDKFNTVVQDVKNFGPKAEAALNRSVEKVAQSAQDFFSHAAEQLLA